MALVEVEAKEVKLLDDPGEGFQHRDVIYTVANRLVNHTRGKIVGGYTKNRDGQIVPGGKYDTGDLILPDALYAVEFALTRGLNPYGQIHTWYQRSGNKPPQIIVEIHWKVLKGWGEWRSPFSTETIEIISPEDRERFGLQDGDLGALAYNILDDHKQEYFSFVKMFVVEFGAREAKKMAAQMVAKGEGVGVVRKAEMFTRDGKPLQPPKGRTWPWRAGIRALRDAIGKSHGEPPPMQVRQYANSEGLAITESNVALLAEPQFPTDAPVDAQQRYLQLESNVQDHQPEAPEVTKAKMMDHVALMRGAVSDDDFWDQEMFNAGEGAENGEFEQVPDWKPTKVEFFETVQKELKFSQSDAVKLLKEAGYEAFEVSDATEMYKALQVKKDE